MMLHRRLIARALLVVSMVGALVLLGASDAPVSAQAAPDWQTSAPRDVLSSGDPATLGLRNKYGAGGQCYQFTVAVYNPYGQPAGQKSDWVCGSDWTYESYLSTGIDGRYSVDFSINGVVVAADQFEVHDF